MSEPEKILIVDDDPLFLAMLQALLKHYTLHMVASGEEALAIFDTFAPHLVLLDINLEGMDGYETCRQIRQRDSGRTLPVIFVSTMIALEDRLQAYGAGGNDYISKPLQNSEVLAKIERLLQLQQRQSELSQELQSSYSLIMSLQEASAHLQSISRFMQSAIFCRDTDRLAQLFFRTAHELGIGCILKLKLEGESLRAGRNITISRLEEEILAMADQVERIYSFGHGRAIFNWPTAVLLVRNATDKLDTIAILMDGLNSGMKSITTEVALLEQVALLESDNLQLKDRISDLFVLMNISFKEAILGLGLSSLTLDEEDRLNDLIDGYHQKINQQMDHLNHNNHRISQLINQLREPPSEVAELLTDEGEATFQEDSGIAFF